MRLPPTVLSLTLGKKGRDLGRNIRLLALIVGLVAVLGAFAGTSGATDPPVENTLRRPLFASTAMNDHGETASAAVSFH